MKKTESKYFNTAARMDEAFLECLEAKDFEYITVKEICQKAGVNRSTFYLHYETIDDLLSESVEYMNRRFLTYLKFDSGNFITRLDKCDIDELYLITPKYLTPYLNYIKDNRRLFLTAIKKSNTLRMENSYNKMFRHIFCPILERFYVPVKDHNYIMKFYIMGLMAIINEWIKNDCSDSVEHIISVIQRCVSRPG